MASAYKTDSGKFRILFVANGERASRTIEAAGLRDALAMGREWEAGTKPIPDKAATGRPRKDPTAAPAAPVVSSNPSPPAPSSLPPTGATPTPSATPVGMPGSPGSVGGGGPKIVSSDTRNALAAALGVKTPEAKKKKKNETLCMMLGHLIGHMYAGALGWAYRQWGNREAAKPDPTQLKEYSDAWVEQLREWFVDVELRPWHTIALVGLAMAFGMWIQGKPIAPAAPAQPERRLASVPAPQPEPVS